jgi:hypothetical protein
MNPKNLALQLLSTRFLEDVYDEYGLALAFVLGVTIVTTALDVIPRLRQHEESRAWRATLAHAWFWCILLWGVNSSFITLSHLHRVVLGGGPPIDDRILAAGRSLFALLAILTCAAIMSLIGQLCAAALAHRYTFYVGTAATVGVVTTDWIVLLVFTWTASN